MSLLYDVNNEQQNYGWAPRVRPERIRRLYETEAQGMIDEELLNDVFYAIYARCDSILTCTTAANGAVKCPRCSTIIQRKDLSNGVESKAEMILCPNCAWKTTWGAFLRSYQGKQLFAGGSEPALRIFMDGALKAKEPREKMMLIDSLIHAYHWEAMNTPTRPVAVNMIAGNNKVIIDLLLGLAYSPHDREMLQTKLEWEEKTRYADERRQGTLYGGRLGPAKRDSPPH